MTIAAVLTAAVLTIAQPPAARCPAGEGEALGGPWGLSVCEKPVQVSVVMYDTPQAGARTVAVADDGLLRAAGLLPGDVIYQVAGVRVRTGREVLAAIGEPSKASGLTVSFWRDGKPYLVRIWAD